MSRAPACSVTASIEPSTYAGTPEIIDVGAAPRRAGHCLRTSSWFPPMPPDDTIVAPAVISNEPTTSREVAVPRAAPDGARISPAAPVTAPSAVRSVVTRWRGRIVTRPRASPSSTAAWNGATIPGPVPQVMWNRGTELPGPVAV